MQSSIVRIFVVDDYAPWRHFVAFAVAERPELQVVGEAPDGLTAIHKATELQPDVVVLDIGLPDITGIEVARQIMAASPQTKILFLTDNESRAVVKEALSTGALAYVAKSDAAADLLPAMKALLAGKNFVSLRLLVRGDSDGPLFR